MPKINEGAPAIQDRIFPEQVKQLLSGTRAGIIAASVGITVMAAVNRGLVDDAVLLAWVAFTAAGLAFRAGVNWLHGRSTDAERNDRYWRRIANLYMAGVVWVGIGWGICGVLFYSPDMPERFVVTMLILLGGAAGSMTIFSPVLRTYIAYVLAVMAPPALNFAYRGGELDVALSVLAVLFILILCVYARRQHKTFIDSFALRFENQDLVNSLTAEKESAEALNRSLANEVLERRAAAERLEASEQRFHDIAAVSSDWHWETDRSGNLIYVSERFEKITGLPVKAFLGKPPFADPTRREGMRMAPDVMEAYTDHVNNLEPFSNVEWSYRDNAGHRHFVTISAAPYYDPKDGSFAGYRGSGTDITERRKIARELEGQTRLLRRAEEAAHVGHWRWNEKDNTIYWSDEMYRIIGVDPETFTPTTGAVFALLHPDDRGAYRDSWERAVRDRIGQEIEARLLRSDGSVRHLWAEIKFEHSDKNDSGEMFGILKDVTEFKLSEAALIDARDEAESANQAKTEFLSSMSHELRTPMNAVLGFAQLLKAEKDFRLSRVQGTFVDEILNAGHHMMELVNDVLDLSGIETGYVKMDLEVVGPNQVVEDCLAMIAALARAQNIEVRTGDCCEVNPPVIADRRRLRQVILNLLSNAVKYNCPGGRVDVSCRLLGDGFLRITVADTGKGIADKDQAHVFEPFNRLGAESSNIGGTGVGLTVTRQLVELMNGRIGFESVPDQGTTFWVDLPLAEETGQVEPATAD